MVSSILNVTSDTFMIFDTSALNLFVIFFSSPRSHFTASSVDFVGWEESIPFAIVTNVVCVFQ